MTAEAFWSKVDASGDCWEWTGTRSGNGYGRTRIDGRSRAAHRIAYELLAGRVPRGLVLDHLCRNPPCVNPDHLEPVTNRENVLRGYGPSARGMRQTHCPKGHEYGPRELVGASGFRRCLPCHAIEQRDYEARHPKVACPKCGRLMRRDHLPRHDGTRGCRSATHPTSSPEAE